MKLDITQNYKRIDNILYCNDIAIVKFKTKFIDAPTISLYVLDYIQRYINLFPDLIEILPGWIVTDDIEEIESVSIEEETAHLVIRNNNDAMIEAQLYPTMKGDKMIEASITAQSLDNKASKTVQLKMITLPDADPITGEVDYNKATESQIEGKVSVVATCQIKSSTTFGVESHDPNSSRLDQVRYWFNKGVTSSSIIASTIDANPSYVQRLVKQIKNEEVV